MSKTKYFLALLVAMVFIAGCSRGDIEKKSSIKIAINSQWPGYAHTYIAREKKFFKNNNVKVDLIPTKDDVASRTLYTNNEVDDFNYFNRFPQVHYTYKQTSRCCKRDRQRKIGYQDRDKFK